MEVKTKFNARDTVYFLGLHDNEPLIHETVVTEVVISQKLNRGDVKESIVYRVSDLEESLPESRIYGCVADLIAYLAHKNQIVCDDPEKINYSLSPS